MGIKTQVFTEIWYDFESQSRCGMVRMKEISTLNLELIRIYNQILEGQLSCDEVISIIRGMKCKGEVGFE